MIVLIRDADNSLAGLCHDDFRFAFPVRFTELSTNPIVSSYISPTAEVCVTIHQ